jgi:hypothetical protein
MYTQQTGGAKSKYIGQQLVDNVSVALSLFFHTS